MAGHSHSANIKYRKDRQDNARANLFLKLQRKIENIIKEEGKITNRVLSIARKDQFPKEKIYNIWEKIKNREENNRSLHAFYQAPFGILIYLENDKDISSDLNNELKLKKMPLSSLSNFFQPLYNLKINLKVGEINLEEYLLTFFPSEIWEKTIYNEKKRELNSSSKKEIIKIKKIIEKNESDLVIEKENNFWKALVIYQITKKEEINYFLELKRKLKNIKFYTNVEI